MTTAVYAILFKHIVTVCVLVMCVCVLQLTPISVYRILSLKVSYFHFFYCTSCLYCFFILPSFAFVEASSCIFYLAILFHASITLLNVM